MLQNTSTKFALALALIIHFNSIYSQSLVNERLFLYGSDTLPYGSSVNDTFFVMDNIRGGVFLGIMEGKPWHRDSIGFNGSFAAGSGTLATGIIGATAIGHDSYARGNWGAVALGENNTASGDYGATAIGYRNLATGHYGATAFGKMTKATGSDGATALGKLSTASGSHGTTALGNQTEASGDHGATALGYKSASKGDIGAIAIGYGVVSTGNSCVAVGVFNDTLVSSKTGLSDESPIFIVGNGDDDNNRSNAMIIKKSGRVGINKTPFNRALEVGGNASKSTAGNWLANSDRRIKTDINDIEDSFTTLLKLRPVTFKYSDEWLDRNPDIKDQYYSNFIAQEYAEVFPKAVQGSGEYLENDPAEILQIDTYDAQIVNIKATQELILKVQILEKENKKLKNRLEGIEASLSQILND